MKQNGIKLDFRNVNTPIKFRFLLTLILIIRSNHITQGRQDIHTDKTNYIHEEDIDNEDYFEENIEYKHVASSTHHIGKLFDMEKELVYRLLHGDFSKLLSNEERHRIDTIIRSETGLLDLNAFETFFSNETVESYVKHTVNAFHLIKRTTRLWPQILLMHGGEYVAKETGGNAKTSVRCNGAKSSGLSLQIL